MWGRWFFEGAEDDAGRLSRLFPSQAVGMIERVMMVLIV
jgi:hypothetical protein